MARVNDTHNTSGKLANEWDHLDDPDRDIADRDRTAIRRFVEYRRDNEGRADNTLINDLGNLRRAATWSDTPLVEMEMPDVTDLLGYLLRPKADGGRGLSREGAAMYGYKRVLRLFFEWLEDHPAYDEYPFWDDIELPKQKLEKVDKESLLTASEVKALKSAAMNPRDKALIEFLADTGARKTLASQLRVCDIHDLDTDRPYYTPNPEGKGHKGAEDTRFPILDSRADLRVYVNNHHLDPRPESPLWHVDSRWYDRENPQEGAMSGDRIGDMLKECADRAGIDQSRVHPHAFRHVALTRMSNNERLTPQEIKHIAGWADDRMLSVYDHTSDAERNEGIYTAAGYLDGEGDAGDGEEGKTLSRPTQCGNCRETLKSDAEYCPNCGTSTSRDIGIPQLTVTGSDVPEEDEQYVNWFMNTMISGSVEERVKIAKMYGHKLPGDWDVEEVSVSDGPATDDFDNKGATE